MEFKIDDRVYCRIHKRYGYIYYIHPKDVIIANNLKFPINVEFDPEFEDEDFVKVYTKDGRLSLEKESSLFKVDLKFKIEKILEI